MPPSRSASRCTIKCRPHPRGPSLTKKPFRGFQSAEDRATYRKAVYDIPTEVDRWLLSLQGFDQPPTSIDDARQFPTFGWNDYIEVTIDLERVIDPWEGPGFVKINEWLLSFKLELLPSSGFPVSLGESPWIHLDRYLGHAHDDDAPEWVANWGTKDCLTGVFYQPRAKMLEIAITLLDVTPSMCDAGKIKAWCFQASLMHNAKITCLCYTGPNEALTACRFCSEPRFNPSGKPQKRFNYVPLIPRLSALFRNPEMVEQMSYRHRYTPKEDIIEDIFDGDIYRTLRNTNVTVGDTEQSYKFFEDKTDIALGFSSDGFAPFKNRKQTCWPLLVFNYNLPPDIRFHFEHLICVGVIPGPKKPKDFDSFLWPFVFELLELALGVKTFHGVLEKMFSLKAYPILGAGDMPAIAMMLLMKGHNGLFPCHLCKIRGILKPGSTNYYVPLTPPQNLKTFGDAPERYDPAKLPLRSHQEFLQDGVYSQSAPNAAQANQRAQGSGVKGVPLLSQVPSLYFPVSFPFDFMHLLYENIYKNIISFWCGTYKDLNHDDQPYRISKTVWEAIGEATAQAARTTPGTYGPAIPNLADDGVRITADMYSFWFQFLGSIFLEKAFTNRIVYNHFVELIRLTNKCLQFSIRRDEVQEIRDGFIKWVQDYERIYYQFSPDRLAACPITIHALLHIADGILLLGPVWVYWAFAMERFCGRLARVIRSRRFPFSNLDNQVLAQAQLTQIKNHYNLHKVLSLHREQSMNWEFYIPNDPRYEKYALVSPRIVDPAIEPSIFKRITAALVTRLSPANARAEDLAPIRAAVKNLLPHCSFEAWGRLRRLECGDTMLASEIIRREMDDARDATFVRYETLVDRNARSANREFKYELATSFGQLQYIYLIKAPQNAELGITRPTYFPLAVINECENPVQHATGLDIHFYTKLRSSVDVVDIATVQSLVGRVFWNKRWAIFDRSGDLARTVFSEDDEDSDM